MKRCKKGFNLFNIYILLWSLDFVQKMFFSSNVISMLLYVPFLLMTIYYVIKVYSIYQGLNLTMKVLCWFFALLVCYGVALLIFNDALGQDRKSFLMMLFESLGPIFAFYIFSKQGRLNEKTLKICFWLILVVSILAFFVYRQVMLELDNNIFDDVTNRAAYDFVGLIPFIFLFKKKTIWQYILLFILSYFIVWCLKRGAMLSGVLALMWFVYVSVESTSKQKKLGVILLTTAALIISYYFINQFYEKSDYFQYRMELTQNGVSSGRDIIYGTLWQHYLDNNNILQLLFGEGAFHTENIVGYKAHNDWFELLIDGGLFMVVIYLIYWFCFLVDCKKVRSNSVVHSMLVSCLIITFSRTFYSMSFSDMLISTNMIMGYCFYNINGQSSKKTLYIENKINN